ncbi:MAG: sulfotransferase domain-containing protein [Opitutae bacterium]|nr:sulfotransferase domain-containing protein [Opitutae bacterium]
MLILSNGTPKSATSLFCYYTRRLVQHVSGDAAELELIKQNDAGKFNGVGYFVSGFNAEVLEQLLEIVKEHGPLVVKMHSSMFPELEQALVDGRCFMTYGYRDPRDMILSARDHHRRIEKKDGKQVLYQFSSNDNAIKHAKMWAVKSLSHIDQDSVHTYSYEDLVGSPDVALRRLARYLNIEISDELIHSLIDEEKASRARGVNELNKAVLTRFEAEMAPELLERCNLEMSEEITALGYVVPAREDDSDVKCDDGYNVTLCDTDDSQLINFNEPEEHKGKQFRWTKSVSSIWLSLNRKDHLCRVDTCSLRRSLPRVGVAVYVNDQRIPVEDLRVHSSSIEFIVRSASVEAAGAQLLTFTVAPSVSIKDGRELGIPMGTLTVEPWSGQTLGIPFRAKKRLRHLVGKKTRIPEPVLPVWQYREFMKPTATVLAKTAELPGEALPCVDRLIVSHSEINGRHGTGILLQHLFPDIADYGVLLTGRYYGGKCVSTRYLVSYVGATSEARQKVYAKVLESFAHHPPRQVYVVPYTDKDFHLAIALKDIFQCEICIHIMDDNHLFGGKVREDVIAEALSKADIVFGISTELVHAYQEKFKIEVSYLPPLVPDDWIGMTSDYQLPLLERPVMIGNIWSSDWLKKLMDLLVEADVKVDWYANNPKAKKMLQHVDSMEDHGLYRHAPLDHETDLLQKDFGARLYTLVPTGPLDGEEDPMEKVARLSLPSRVILLVAGGGLPVLVVGSRESAVARFVLQNEIGCVVSYDAEDFNRGVVNITESENNARYRANAKRIAPLFSCSGIEDWIWDSTSAQRPIDDRFERMMD